MPPLTVTSATGYGAEPSLRRRAVSFVLAVAITLLIIVGFLGLNGSVPERPRFKGGRFSIDLSPDRETQADTSKSKTASRAAPRPRTAVKPPPPPPVVPPQPLPTPQSSPYILLSKQEYESFDFRKVGRLGSSQGQQQQGADAAGGAMGSGSAPGDSRTVGTAPDGQPLYQAEWYRKPTQAELSPYLPASMPIRGWGLIACKTVARYHVDDCVELGSSPPGSRLAGAVRQAAWQFLVRPPRIGGRDLIGSWVRIRIDYLPAVAKKGSDDAPAGEEDSGP